MRPGRLVKRSRLNAPPTADTSSLCITFCCLCQPLREKPGNVPPNLRWDTASLAVSQGSIATSGREQIHDSQHKHQTQLAAHLGCNSRLYLHLFSQGDSVRVCARRMRELGEASGKRFQKLQSDGWFPLTKWFQNIKYTEVEKSGRTNSSQWKWSIFCLVTFAAFWTKLFSWYASSLHSSFHWHSIDLCLESEGNLWPFWHFSLLWLFLQEDISFFFLLLYFKLVDRFWSIAQCKLVSWTCWNGINNAREDK